VSKFKVGNEVQWDGKGVGVSVFPQKVKITGVKETSQHGVFYTFIYCVEPNGYTQVASDIPESWLEMSRLRAERMAQ
jgi:hypothetical protein